MKDKSAKKKRTRDASAFRRSPNHEGEATHAGKSFPIVGIGASAGGLDAFTRFFQALPEEPGMAFVLIQHLDPTHDSMMSDLLGRRTQVRVLQVTKEMEVEKNTAYIIPPGKYLGLENNRLILSDLPEQRGMRMAVDHFFETLARARKEKAICIVLSGTGTDGTLGLKAVKASGGLALVQDPETAQQEGMPRSAINTGAVDRIMAPEEMPRFLLEYANHPYVNGEAEDPPREATARKPVDVLDTILNLLFTRTGHEFHAYKKGTLQRRVHRRMSLTQVMRMEDYLDLLQSDDRECEALFKDLLINVTSFFREPEAWQALEELVLPRLVERCDRDRTIRVWTPGCSTGEETYSIAILLQETMEQHQKRCSLQIFGTDIDREAYQVARAGRYPESIESQVSAERLNRFFDRDQDQYVIKKQVRETVVFAPQSLLSDPPFTGLDLIICRNLLIYLENDIQEKILRLFHFALKDGGYLFLGNSENTGQQRHLFEPVSKSRRIYRRLAAARPAHIDLPVFQVRRPGERKEESGRRPGWHRSVTPAEITRQAVLAEYAPPSVLVDRAYDVLYYLGGAGEFLRQPEGEPTRNLLEQMRPGMKTRLRALLHRVVRSGRPSRTDEGRMEHEAGGHRRVVLEATPLTQPPEAEGMILVTFRPRPETGGDQGTGPAAAAPGAAEDQDGTAVEQLEQELHATREELQATIEELETANEELKASNEEVMSMNEELQSTNEELETSKEELQSLNEELTTVNNELREKVQELEEANDDIANLLASTHIPTLFLDRDLKLKRFTPATENLMHLVPSDVGRPIDHIARWFDDPGLLADCHLVLKDLAPREREIPSHDGRWHNRRILPYRTQNDRIGGLVIAFFDITQRRKDLQEIQAREDQLRLAIREAPLPVILFAEDGQVILLSKAWEESTGFGVEEMPAVYDWPDGVYGTSRAEAREHLERVFRAGRRTKEGEFTIRSREDEERYWVVHSSPLGTLSDGRRALIGMAIDITDRKRFEEALQRSEQQLQEMNASLEEQVEERTRSLELKSSQLRRLTSELSQVEQRERRRLASTLHDHIQQLIASARMQLEVLGQDLEGQSHEDARRIQNLINEAAEACRNVTAELAPPVLYEGGFVQSMQWLCSQFGDHHNIEVHCRVPDLKVEPLDQETSVLLFQSVKELLFNVVKHSGAGRARLVVETDGSRRLRISVIDEGDGFDPEGEFQKEGKDRGFGLFSIRERVSIANGRMDVVSSPGEGTRVTLTVPARAGDSRAPFAAAAEGSPSPAGPGSDAGAIRVLVVDDHAIFRDGMASLLEKEEGIQVLDEASNGEEAVEKATRLKPDVVLMDINMPGMNGIEATRRIMKERPGTRIIGLSVHAEDDIAESMREAGAADYVTKGGPSRELFAAIRGRGRP
jgi:two-component system CheB/CheR fusion protein